MFNKKIMFIVIVVISLLAISAVSAGEDNGTVIASEGSGDDVVDVAEEDVASITPDDNIAASSEIEEEAVSQSVSQQDEEVVSQSVSQQDEEVVSQSVSQQDEGVVSQSVSQQEEVLSSDEVSAEECLYAEDWYEQSYWYMNYKDLPKNYKASVKLTPTKLTTDYASGKNFKVKVTNSKTKKPMEGIVLSLKIYTGSKSKTVNVITDKKGIAKYSASFLSPGKHKVVVNVNKKTKHISAVKKETSYIVIKKASGKLTATKLKTTYGSGKYFKVKLINTKTRKAMKNFKLTLKIYTGGKAKKVTVKTNSKGIAKYDTSKLKVGKHKVIVKVKNGKLVSAKSKTSSIKINKASLKISAPKVVNAHSDNQKFNVVVKNKETGKLLKGIKVTIKVYTNGKAKKFTVKTDSKGVAAISTKSLSIGSHSVKASVAANSNYKSANAKSTITIKIKTVLFYSGYQYDYTANGSPDGYSLNITLYDEYGNKLTKTLHTKEYHYYSDKEYTSDNGPTYTSGELIKAPYRYSSDVQTELVVIFKGDSKYYKTEDIFVVYKK